LGSVRRTREFAIVWNEKEQKLAYMGHRIRPNTGAWGGYQAIWRQDDPLRYFGGSDPRKDGCAIGF
jgi:gamma-glutamyltranspeptidase/glutathione hydrolase